MCCFFNKKVAAYQQLSWRYAGKFPALAFNSGRERPNIAPDYYIQLQYIYVI